MNVEIPVYVLPGGVMPERHGGNENVGFDICVRALVSLEMDDICIGARKILSDFETCAAELIPDLFLRKLGRDSTYELHPVLRPGVPIILGFGFVLGLPKGWYAEVWPRTSTVGLSAIELLHKGIPIDSGFRGEPVSAVRNDGSRPFSIYRGQRLAQLKFFGPEGDFRPKLFQVKSFEELPKSYRGSGNHGSTGFR